MANVREYQIAVANATGTVTLTPALQTGILVTDFWVVKGPTTGGTNDAVQLQDGAGNAISNNVSLNNVAEDAVTRALTIDDAFSSVTTAENLQIAAVSDTNCSCTCFIAGIPQ